MRWIHTQLNASLALNSCHNSRFSDIPHFTPLPYNILLFNLAICEQEHHLSQANKLRNVSVIQLLLRTPEGRQSLPRDFSHRV